MPLYLGLINWTPEGAKSFRESAGRADAASGLAEQLGGRMKELLWTQGPYDLVVLVEMPDDEAMAAFGLAVNGRGATRTTTLRAFDRAEFESIVGRVPG